MPRSSSFAALLVVTCASTCASSQAGAWPLLAGRIDRVVAAGERAAVLRGGEALLLDEAGRTVGRCLGADAPAGRPRRADGTTIPAERLLREAGFREDDDSPEAEALLSDEGIEPRRRRAPIAAAAGMPRALALAVGPEAVWLGTVDGLWRLDARTAACRRAGLSGRTLDLVAAAARVVVAVADVTVWRSVDGGASFAVAAVLTARARAVALAGDGSTAFVATDEAVVAVTATRYARPVLERRADAVVTCGARAIALAEDGVYALDPDGRVERLGDRPPTRALACLSPDGPRLLAAGVGAWVTDDGRTWQEVPAFLGRSIADVSFAAGRAWLALEDGLVAHALGGAPDGGASRDAAGELPAPESPRRARVPAHPSPPSWAWLLPRVSVSFDGFADSRARSGWRLWLVLTVTLDRRRFGRSSSGAPESSEVLQ